jgi:glycosyltransferase involved in cell wall biosynthesis
MTTADQRPVILHDFLIQDGGAERCLVEFARLLPQARIETTFFDADEFADRIGSERLRGWPLQRLFGPTRRFRMLLPLYPAWFTARTIRAPLVLSSSVAFCKAARVAPGGLHISYVYTPMRYAWDLDTYMAGSSFGWASQLGARLLRPALQRWDVWSSRRPDVIVTISETVRQRVATTWGRSSEIIFPPVDTEEIQQSSADDGFLLVAARLLAYRRVDLAVRAATQLGRPLMVVGEGPEMARLSRMAGPTVRFLGHVPRATVVELMRTCHAYLVPGVEDFGIAPVEAMAAGRPVVAFGAGGVAETVVDGLTGVFFHEPTVDALVGAIAELDRSSFDRLVIRRRAEEFDTAVFRRRWLDLFERLGIDPAIYSAA